MVVAERPPVRIQTRQNLSLIERRAFRQEGSIGKNVTQAREQLLKSTAENVHASLVTNWRWREARSTADPKDELHQKVLGMQRSSIDRQKETPHKASISLYLRERSLPESPQNVDRLKRRLITYIKSVKAEATAEMSQFNTLGEYLDDRKAKKLAATEKAKTETVELAKAA